MRSLLNSRVGKATFKVLATQDSLFFREFSDPYILVKVVDSETDRTRTNLPSHCEARGCALLHPLHPLQPLRHQLRGTRASLWGDIPHPGLETEKKIRALLAEGQMAALVIDMDSWGGSSAEAQSMSALLLHKTMKGIPILFFVRARHSVQPTS